MIDDTVYSTSPLSMYAQKRLKDLQEAKDLHVAYLKCKLRNEDWHGVEDAASDIRDMEASMLEVRRFLEQLA